MQSREPDVEAEKAAAAAWAVNQISEGMLVGLGTGSTANYAIDLLGERVRGGLKVHATPTSVATEALARAAGIPIVPSEGLSCIDLTIDGADQIDRQFRAIKGRGGALFREKVIAAASSRTIIAVDSGKVVQELGQHVVPIEILPEAKEIVRSKLRQLFNEVQLRKTEGRPFRTDQGNYILDAYPKSLADPDALAAGMSAIPGLIEHGLFLTEVDTIVVGRGKDVEVIERSRSNP